MFGEHARAGAARRHDVVAFREGGDGLARDRLGVGAIARIIGGLAAAGLRGHDDLAARVLEQLDRREADARPDEIDETGDEQADPLAGPRQSLFYVRQNRALPRRRRGHWTSAGRVSRRGGKSPLPLAGGSSHGRSGESIRLAALSIAGTGRPEGFLVS